MIISSEKKIKIFDNAIFVFVCLYFFAEFIMNLNIIKSIGVYTSVVLIMFFLILCREIAIARFKENFFRNKTMFLILLLLVLVTFASSLFPYDSTHNSVKEFMRVVKKEYLLFVLLFFWFDGSEKRSKIIFWVLVGSLFYESIYTIIKSVIEFDPKMLQKRVNVVYRDYSICVDGLFAFSLIAFLFVKKRIWLQVALALLLAMVVVLDILSGARASWLAMFVVFLLCFLFFIFKNKFSLKTALYIGLFFALVGGVATVAYETFPHIKYKLTQKTSSGRDLILKNRLPLILNSDRALIGLGYGTDQYEKFIFDNRDKATGNLGPARVERDKNKKVKFIHYFHDEPAFIAYYYHVGVGVIFFIALVFYIIYKGMSEFVKRNNYLLFSVALSVVSFYLVRGTFEWFGGLKPIIAMCALFIVLNYKNKEAVTNEN
ncbi:MULTISPECIES: O-antigen ligase family protein [unclassified Campylobacter]|uniref:O-antigen ligase family protein n=1 Tax=unclassified Campylobacter TaxID=2593542 RepID=UPI0022E9A384|nr:MULTISPECIES: O-antigen ligase family protein [unclassified Campylobacter]MDA3056039.1 O-antigen ligase family protein [Campylobacter sp. CN_NA1]MDA3065184.1 O-antigen ligase family protein [Campylobacter sp. CN_NE4]MDA3068009.1 O-antigen ligase family protein [Campylobacter sp. CN_NE3]MDA3082638.1 O-antigen ligase family protein [Campylobacter sp. CN_EL2]MDA3083624.1 O-antigen ligase family protein [Campylobacter sp. CN_NE1]